jgi:CO/xanthine dehydrogenase FAD-binding subunit
MIHYERYRTDDRALTRVQDRVEQFANALQQTGLLDGRLIEGIEFAASTTQNVYHGLKRKYRGYIVVSVNAKAIIQVDDTKNNNKSKFLALQSYGTACTASLWVF